MRPPKILLFILSVFALLFAVWYFMPAEGVHVCGMKVKFPSYESYLQELHDPMRNINLDSLMEVTDLYQWYVDTHLGGEEELEGRELVFRCDLPDEEKIDGNWDFDMVITVIELNEQNEIVLVLMNAHQETAGFHEAGDHVKIPAGMLAEAMNQLDDTNRPAGRNIDPSMDLITFVE